MDGLDRWDLALLAAAALAAVWKLAALMRDKRSQLVADVQQQVQAERAARAKAKAAEEQQAA